MEDFIRGNPLSMQYLYNNVHAAVESRPVGGAAIVNQWRRSGPLSCVVYQLHTVPHCVLKALWGGPR